MHQSVDEKQDFFSTQQFAVWFNLATIVTEIEHLTHVKYKYDVSQKMFLTLKLTVYRNAVSCIVGFVTSVSVTNVEITGRNVHTRRSCRRRWRRGVTKTGRRFGHRVPRRERTTTARGFVAADRLNGARTYIPRVYAYSFGRRRLMDGNQSIRFGERDDLRPGTVYNGSGATGKHDNAAATKTAWRRRQRARGVTEKRRRRP